MLVTPDWVDYGTLKFLQGELTMDFTAGPGWYKRNSDCILLADIGGGFHRVYVFNNKDPRPALLALASLPERN